MKALLFMLSVMMILTLSSLSGNRTSIGQGQQPQVSVDNKGTIRVVFGSGDQIFCATSIDHSASFGKPVLVANVPEMHLGMSRRPQLASSKNYSVISAIDKAEQSGEIFVDAGLDSSEY
ncbi:hypothetical protein ABIB62_004499 [Mucilaginibacter sp. UYP25]|uniref:hypothetical protein n=1 Tax=unclassified Mucilaginibacter TaxID=2617802 RepID=UPI0033980DA9